MDGFLEWLDIDKEWALNHLEPEINEFFVEDIYLYLKEDLGEDNLSKSEIWDYLEDHHELIVKRIKEDVQEPSQREPGEGFFEF